MNFGSLFSGIGLIDLGLQRAGWQVRGQCEIEPFGRMILEKHWPDIQRWNDVRTLSGQLIRDQWGPLDALAAGVPCQPASLAGQRRGAADDRWMWPHYLRLVSEINDAQERPLVWLLAENPDDVLSLQVEGRSFRDWIEAEFQSLGYSLFVGKFGADCLGAPHERQRVWIVGHATGSRRPSASPGGLRQQPGRGSENRGEALLSPQRENAADESGDPDSSAAQQRTGVTLANHNGHGQQQPKRGLGEERGWDRNGSQGAQGEGMAFAFGSGLEGQRNGTGGAGPQVAVPAGGSGYEWPAFQGEFQHEWEQPREITDAEIKSSLGPATDGIPRDVARWRVAALKACGNAIVPQCAEVLGRAILEADATA